MLEKYFNKLANILRYDDIYPKLISAEIITLKDDEKIDQMTTTEKTTYVLRKIARSLQSRITNSFYTLLQIMEDNGGDIAELARNIRSDLSGNPNVNSF